MIKWKNIAFLGLSGLVLGACSAETDADTTSKAEEQSVVVETTESSSVSTESKSNKISSIVEESVEAESKEVASITSEVSTAPDVSREFKNALGSAKQYLDYTNFSKTGLYDQLIYEEYPEDAAQYAVDNVAADWNKNALGAAIQYLDYSSFSDQGLYDQLIYEGYTEEQAQYAIDNLPN